MNKFISSVLVLLVLAVGGLYLRKPEVTVQTTPVQVDQPDLVGANPGLDHLSNEYFKAGVSATKYFGLSTVNASTTSSTAPTLQLGKGSSGIITVGTSTPAIRTQNASTTAVSSSNSVVKVTQVANGPAGVTCNTTQATNTLVSTLFASSTAPSLNGFSLVLGSIPTTNPACFFYEVFERSTNGY